MFVIFAVPGYLLAVTKMDRIGHRRLQFIGFSIMAACFVVLAIVPALTQHVAPFLAILGLAAIAGLAISVEMDRRRRRTSIR